ncbi:hypothetical protein ACFY78_40325 [Streptomyces olindensis]|uniref:hypothetical protein n=1 Tax=Streptomyces olindensis TaxID=358823 RepID=UPI0036BC2D8A
MPEAVRADCADPLVVLGTGRKAVVIGGTSGMGLAVARRVLGGCGSAVITGRTTPAPHKPPPNWPTSVRTPR